MQSRTASAYRPTSRALRLPVESMPTRSADEDADRGGRRRERTNRPPPARWRLSVRKFRSPDASRSCSHAITMTARHHPAIILPCPARRPLPLSHCQRHSIVHCANTRRAFGCLARCACTTRRSPTPHAILSKSYWPPTRSYPPAIR